MSNKGLLAAHLPCIHALQYELILYGLFMYKIQYILSWVDPIWTKEWLTLMSIYRMCKTTGEHNSWENEDIGLFVDSHFVVETRRSLESHDLAKMMRMCTCGLKSSLRGSLPLMEDLSTLSSSYIHKLNCNYTVACITFWKSFQKNWNTFNVASFRIYIFYITSSIKIMIGQKEVIDYLVFNIYFTT